MLCQLSYASRHRKIRAAAMLAHGTSRNKFLLLSEKYSIAAGLVQNVKSGRMGALEIEGQAGADAALLLSEDQQGAVAQ
jgi:hypothetical protein